jgi:hypothetical protein
MIAIMGGEERERMRMSMRAPNESTAQRNERQCSRYIEGERLTYDAHAIVAS